jgi:hypothetical protein
MPAFVFSPPLRQHVYTGLFYTDPGYCNFLEEMRAGCGTFWIFLNTGLKLRIVKRVLIVFCVLPNCIVEEYTTTRNSAVKLCRNEPWLSLHDSGISGPLFEKLIDVIRFHIKFID